MSMSDPIADMLTRIRNAQLAKKRFVFVPSSKIKYAIAEVLRVEGYVSEIERTIIDNHPYIKIDLKYYTGTPVIEKIKRVSKPGLRIYKSVKEIPDVMNGLGISIISTSKGVMTGREAKEAGVGGEILCEVV